MSFCNAKLYWKMQKHSKQDRVGATGNEVEIYKYKLVTA